MGKEQNRELEGGGVVFPLNSFRGAPFCPLSLPLLFFSCANYAGLFGCVYFSFQACAFQCHHCTSNVSWDDCSAKTRKVTCQNSSQCLSAKRFCDVDEVITIYFYKRCNKNGTACGPKKGEAPQCATGLYLFEDDSYSCCSGELCNAGSSIMLNIFVLPLCLILIKPAMVW